MTIDQLNSVLGAHGVKIDSYGEGAGKFRTLYIGTGESHTRLRTIKTALDEADKAAGSPNPEICHLTRVTNREHPDFGKPMLVIESYWWD